VKDIKMTVSSVKVAAQERTQLFRSYGSAIFLFVGFRGFVWIPHENVARLAAEFAAQRFECREADRLRLAGLEDRQVRKRNADAITELGERHTPVQKDPIEGDADRHWRRCRPLLDPGGPSAGLSSALTGQRIALNQDP